MSLGDPQFPRSEVKKPNAITNDQAEAALRRRARVAYLARYATLAAFALVIICFSIARPHTFPTWSNWTSILNLGSAVIVISVFLTVPMLVGDFDLSIAYNVQLLGGFAIILMTKDAIGPGLSVLLTLLLGMAIGTALGLLVVLSRASAFVITLGAGIIFLGIETKLTGQKTIFTGVPPSYGNIADAKLLGWPLAIWIMLVAVVVLWFVTERTVLGRSMAAIGDNREAARLGGIGVSAVRVMAFTIVGFGAALAGVLLTSQSQQYYPNLAVGDLLPAYAGVFLGAATLRPGQFQVIGTFIGAVFLQVIQNGLIILNFPTYLSSVITGAVLILAVMLTRLTKQSS